MNEQTQGPDRLSQLLEKALGAVAIAALIGLGSTVLTNWSRTTLLTVETQSIENRLEHHENLHESMVTLLEETRRQLAVLNERITWLNQFENK